MPSVLRPFKLTALCLALSLTACPSPEVTPEVPLIETAGAEPQTTPVPTGDADAGTLPQISGLSAAAEVRPGQVVTVRLATNFPLPGTIEGVAIVIDGIDGWFKATPQVRPGGESDEGLWIAEIQVVIAESAQVGEVKAVELAFLGPADAAGGFRSWQPVVGEGGVLNCEMGADADCSNRECGPDPLCGTECAPGCGDGASCSVDGVCEGLGGACAGEGYEVCGGRECGQDPFCGDSCGECPDGVMCMADGLCDTGSDDCGNGSIDAGEACDDGPDNGNGSVSDCRSNCTLTTCGDGFDGASESCDLGTANSDNGDCTSTCTVAVCGDGLVHNEDGGTETCDEGPQNGVSGPSNGCTADCQVNVCGDGFQSEAETCDDGNTTDGDGCASDCTLESCGDGILDPGEDCDEGGETATCDADCTAVACGDLTVNATAGEVCDDGTNGSAACDTDCTLAECGDTTVNPLAGEDCDDGAETATCDADCTAVVCGDSVVNATAGETCDAGGQTATCDLDCTDVVCGDGYVNSAAGETCDDANTVDGDGCSACQLETCGNGIVNANEECDDGGETVNCDIDCTLPVCGDLVVNTAAGETCDDGSAGSANCDSDCSAPSCGDGVVNTLSGEACDDAGASATCDDDCTLVECGDGVLNAVAGEACDDGNLVNTDACVNINGACVVASCGDGYLQTGVEVCDDGATTGTPGGSDCLPGCTATNVCGDAYAGIGEACDDGGVNTATCNTDCTTPVCGDGIHNPAAGEACDTAGNSLSCDADCTAPSCGDGLLNTAALESCDGSDFGGESCATLSEPTGDLSCNNLCQIDISGCDTVQPLWPINGAAWNSWVDVSGAANESDYLNVPDQGCAVNPGGQQVGQCVQAGRVRTWFTSAITSCADVNFIFDDLGWFGWSCFDDAGGVRVVSQINNAPFSNFIDMSNPSEPAFLENRVNIDWTGGVESSGLSTWWDNPVTLWDGSSAPLTGLPPGVNPVFVLDLTGAGPDVATPQFWVPETNTGTDTSSDTGAGTTPDATADGTALAQPAPTPRNIVDLQLSGPATFVQVGGQSASPLASVLIQGGPVSIEADVRGNPGTGVPVVRVRDAVQLDASLTIFYDGNPTNGAPGLRVDGSADQLRFSSLNFIETNCQAATQCPAGTEPAAQFVLDPATAGGIFVGQFSDSTSVYGASTDSAFDVTFTTLATDGLRRFVADDVSVSRSLDVLNAAFAGFVTVNLLSVDSEFRVANALSSRFSQIFSGGPVGQLPGPTITGTNFGNVLEAARIPGAGLTFNGGVVFAAPPNTTVTQLSIESAGEGGPILTVDEGTAVLGATIRPTLVEVNPPVGVAVPAGLTARPLLSGVWMEGASSHGLLLESDADVFAGAFNSAAWSTVETSYDLLVTDTARASTFAGTLYVRNATGDLVEPPGTCAITTVAGETVNVGQGATPNCLAEDATVNVIGTNAPTFVTLPTENTGFQEFDFCINDAAGDGEPLLDEISTPDAVGFTDEVVHTFVTTDAAICASVGGTWTSPDRCDLNVLRNAIEINDDLVGNNNGLCQSGERCLVMRNIGAYQGERTLLFGGPDDRALVPATPPSYDGTNVTNVTLVSAPTNGLCEGT